MNRNLKLILLSLLVLEFSSINAADLVYPQFQGVRNICTKMGINTNQYGQNNICDLSNIGCTGNPAVVYSLNFNGVPTEQLSSDDFIPFINLSYVTLKNMPIDPEIMVDMGQLPHFSDLDCDNCTINYFPPGVRMNHLDLNQTQIVEPIPFSYLKDIKNIKITNNNQSIIYVNDLTELQENPFMLTSDTSNIPDLSYLDTYGFTFYLQSTFNENDFANISTAVNAYIMTLDSRSFVNQIRFPVEVLSLSQLTNFNSYISTYKVPTSAFSLANANSLSTLGIYNANNFALSNGGFPFINQKNNVLNFVTFQNGKLNGIPFSTLRVNRNYFVSTLSGTQSLSNITFNAPTDRITNDYTFWNSAMSQGYNIWISNNNLTGNVPNYVCDTVVNLSNNKLTGNLPSCLTCFLNDTFIQGLVANNQFSNYNQLTKTYPPCTTLSITSLGFYRMVGQYRTYYYIGIKGTDLGVRSKISSSDPLIQWSPYIQNQFYIARIYSMASYKDAKLNITFVAPNQTFELDFSTATQVFVDIPIFNEPVLPPLPSSSSSEDNGNPNNSHQIHPITSMFILTFIAILKLII